MAKTKTTRFFQISETNGAFIEAAARLDRVTALCDRADDMTGAGWVAKHFPAVNQKRSAGVAGSWADPETRTARMTRNAVEVDGVKYQSVAEAFRQLGLPMSKHIKFRGQLKQYGEQSFGQHDFRIVAA